MFILYYSTMSHMTVLLLFQTLGITIYTFLEVDFFFSLSNIDFVFFLWFSSMINHGITPPPSFLGGPNFRKPRFCGGTSDSEKKVGGPLYSGGT